MSDDKKQETSAAPASDDADAEPAAAQKEQNSAQSGPKFEQGPDPLAGVKKTAADAGESPARWLLAELSIRLSQADTSECQKLVQTIQTRYMQEPGVAQGLYEILVSYGIISPEGMPAGPRPAAQPQLAAAPVAEPASKLWTPDAPAAEAGGEKSKLWIPGMD